MAQFVDWDLAAATAGALSKSGPAVSYDEATQVVAELRTLTDEAAGHVAAYTGLTSQVDVPPVRVVDRKDWAAVNIAGLKQVIVPLVSRLSGDKQPGAFADAIGSRVTGVQAGTVLAYLSGRVLGQYEVFSGDPGQLLLNAPNIVEVERKIERRPARLPALGLPARGDPPHPVHRGAVDARLLPRRGRRRSSTPRRAAASTSSSGCAAAWPRCPTRCATRTAASSVLDIVQTPAQKAVLDRLTALMTLLEGHAEFVMDGVGPEVIPTVESIRAKFNQRRESGNPLEKAIRRLLGIEVKMRQYAEGRKFVHGVVERVGMAGFNKIFGSPLTLPRLDELGDPDAWVARVHGPVGRPRRLSRRWRRIPPPVAAVRLAVRRALRRAAGRVAGAGGLLGRGRFAGAGRGRPRSSRPGSACGRAGHRRPRAAGRVGRAGRGGGRLGRRPASTRSRWPRSTVAGRPAARRRRPGRPVRGAGRRGRRRCGAPAVLLGHTRDDQAETVLLALARGAGPRGLAGMPVRGDGVCSSGRCWTSRRADTRKACAALGLTAWDDPHNTDPAYARSRVRADALPALVAALGPGGGRQPGPDGRAAGRRQRARWTRSPRRRWPPPVPPTRVWRVGVAGRAAAGDPRPGCCTPGPASWARPAARCRTGTSPRSTRWSPTGTARARPRCPAASGWPAGRAARPGATSVTVVTRRVAAGHCGRTGPYPRFAASTAAPAPRQPSYGRLRPWLRAPGTTPTSTA